MVSMKGGKETPVERYVHDETRVYIPTEELRAFVAEDEKAPKTLLYPRDTSLDPQLVWKGKDEQDRDDLSVPAVPIYVQEKIEPRAIIEDLRTASGSIAEAPEQYSLFEQFDSPSDLDTLVDFYRHDQSWTNRMILGDSLLVMASLAEKEGLKGKVQCIYMDPPYGIKFGSNWQVSAHDRGVRDGKEDELTPQPEQIRAFRDTWKLGIHSYLAYMRDRLIVARDLLADTGSIFVQIGDENVHLVRALLDEVFGRESFVSMISFTKAPGGLEASNRIGSRLDYLLWYSTGKTGPKYRPLFEPRRDPVSVGFTQVELGDGSRRPMTAEERAGVAPLPPDARPFMTVLLTKPGPGAKYAVEFEGRTFDSGARWWGMPKESLHRLIDRNRVVATQTALRFVRYLDDFPYRSLSNLWDGLAGASDPIYVVQTNDEVVKRCILMTTDPGDLVIDPTCGSGTTAHVAEQWGRRWIAIDTSRVALAIARARLMSSRYPYYVLADSPEGQRRGTEMLGAVPQSGSTRLDIRKGFVCRRVPRVTVSSIANNPDIREGMTREEIDAAIARHAETETLYDQPYEDPRRVRVTGPFTVESLSPYRTLAPDEERPRSEENAEQIVAAGKFEETILEHLRKAGVQNTIKGERLTFDRLEPFAGEWLQAAGEYTDKDGETRRAAVCIGPQYDTVGQDNIKEAAKEAIKGIGFDVLIVCGFAFDPMVSETARQIGKLTVLITRMNPDLSMGDTLLKNTGAGNLFTVFGEPDMQIEGGPDGPFTVSINGVDIYDPTTGEIRSATPDSIACWFIDTDYNGESFFVRHAYFTGGNDPFGRLKRALKAEINEPAWASLYSTTSRPFPRPSTGKVAVKVINDYGDEVMKVFGLDQAPEDGNA